MSVLAATSAADKYMRAWDARTWIADPAEMPPPPATVRDMYLVHEAVWPALQACCAPCAILCLLCALHSVFIGV